MIPLTESQDQQYKRRYESRWFLVWDTHSVSRDEQVYLEKHINKTVGTFQKQTHRSIEQDEKPRNKSCLYGQLIYDKQVNTIQGRNGSLFQVVLGKLDN